jgi:hypothetical protein
LDQEARTVEAKIRASAYRDNIRFVTAWAATPDDLQQILLQHQPAVLHFSGHGKTDGIVLDDGSGHEETLGGDLLRRLLKIFKKTVKLVFLNACYSRPQAEQIVESIPLAIGMKRPIGDSAAISFAASFYRAVGFGRSVQDAFDLGCISAELTDSTEADNAGLLHAAGVDPSDFHLFPAPSDPGPIPGSHSPPGQPGDGGPRKAPMTAVVQRVIHLPETGTLLVGRTKELDLLDQYWQERKANVVSIIGSGGSGKTSLLNHWLGKLATRTPPYDGARNVFAWHFTDAQDEVAFLEESASFFQVDLQNLSSLDEKWRRLADVVSREPNLLVLDQFEVLQSGPPQMGAVLRHFDFFLRTLAGRNAGLCVITTRFAISNFASGRGTTAPVIELGPLTEDAGGELLQALRVQGTTEELKQASADYSGHALALTLLGNFLRLAYRGDIRRRDQVILLDQRDLKGQHAERVCANYEKWFERRPDGKVELSILRLFGLFVGPLVLEQFRYLAARPKVTGLNDQLYRVDALEINRALERLQEAGLLIKRRGTRASWLPFDEELDAHPLVREYFGSKLRAEGFEEAWKKGNARLYEYLAARGPKQPETLDDMRPIYQAIVHACEAGRHRDGLKLYQQRLQRGDEWYSAKKVAAFSYELMVMKKFFSDDYVTLVKPEPRPTFEGQERFTIFMATARALRAQKRLPDAARLFDEASKITATLKQWVSALANWCEVKLLQGNLDDSQEEAERIYEKGIARSNDELKTTGLVHLALVDWMRGNGEQALSRFKKGRKAGGGELSLMDGCWECEIELDHAISIALGDRIAIGPGRKWWADPRRTLPSDRVNKAKELLTSVQKKAERFREAAIESRRPVESSRYQLAAGRALLLEAVYCCPIPDEQSRLLGKSASLIEEAIYSLQESQQHLVFAILAQATLKRLQRDFAYAASLLQEAEEVAVAGGIKCYLPDVFLEFTRLELDRADFFAAADNLNKVNSAIESMPGYGRLAAEISDVKARLQEAGKSPGQE